MRHLGLLSIASLVALGGCEVQKRANRVDPASFKLTVICAGRNESDCPTVPAGADVCGELDPTKPPNLGKPDAPVSNDQKFYLVNVEAMGNDGETYTPYEGTANVYVMFNGTVSPPRNALTEPAQKLPFRGGKACLKFNMPPAFNKTAIWVEDSGPERKEGSWAIGATEAIYRQAPTIADIQRTTSSDTASPLALKQVIIKGGSNGRPLVVTSVTQSSFTVTDLGTQNDDYRWGSLLIFTFSKPTGVRVGQKVMNVAGALSEFNGLTELNFPSWEFEDRRSDFSLVPPPHEIKITSTQDNDLVKVLDRMEPYESALVQAKNWVICDLDVATFKKYGQWRVAYPSKSACNSDTQTLSIITNQTVPSYDLEKLQGLAGKTVCSIKGILSHVIPTRNINLWMITPRDAEDVGTIVNAKQDCP